MSGVVIVQSRVSDRQGRCLAAAARGRLFAAREYGAVRYLTLRPGPDAPAVFRPDDIHECVSRGWMAWADEGAAAVITEPGRAALDEYRLDAQRRSELPYTITRNALRGELHAPHEPIRILRDARTGREIEPGDSITDPFGEPITYLGPTMSRTGDNGAWRPGRIARVLYPGEIPWVFLPAEIGATYDDMPSADGA